MARGKDAIFWAIPGAVALVAAVLAYRAFRSGPDEPSRDAPQMKISLCEAGRYLCRKGEVLATTGEEGPEGGDRCVRRKLSKCARGCVAEEVTLAGMDEESAKRQLCDMPEYVNVYIRDEKNLLGMPAADAESCEGDGFAPTVDGIQQCILRSVVDPNALGVVVSTARCRLGAVQTIDRQPRLVSREQAIALWCRRDAAAAAALDTGGVDIGPLGDPLDAGDVGDGVSDASDASLPDG